MAYTEVSVVGKGVFEYSDAKAKNEITNLAKEVFAIAEQFNLAE